MAKRWHKIPIGALCFNSRDELERPGIKLSEDLWKRVDDKSIINDVRPFSCWMECKAETKIVTYTIVDPKQAQACKKMTFDSVTTTLMLIVSEAAKSGSDKYGIRNWLALAEGSMSLMTYINAVQRHLILFNAGQDRTSDTDIHNLDAIICGLSVVRDAMIFGKVFDDRVKLSAEQVIRLEKIINKEIKV